jgi:hypothetical protein
VEGDLRIGFRLDSPGYLVGRLVACSSCGVVSLRTPGTADSAGHGWGPAGIVRLVASGQGDAGASAERRCWPGKIAVSGGGLAGGAYVHARSAAAGTPASGGGGRCGPLRHWPVVSAARSAVSRHPALRYLQIIPVGLVLWGLDAVDRSRSGAALAGFAHAAVINAISRQLGGGFADQMNDWLAVHRAATWYYIVVQGAVTAVIGLLLIWRRVPAFRLHRDALIACNVIGLVVFWLYPVAPPRMLPGYHDVTAAAVPLFSSLLEGRPRPTSPRSRRCMSPGPCGWRWPQLRW